MSKELSESDQTVNMDYVDDIIEYTSCKGTREQEILTTAIFEVEQLGKKRLKISGIALAEGVWKNVIYSAKEIMKAAKQMVGKPLLVEHGQTKEFGKTEVGKVVNAYYDKILHSLVFVAEVLHPRAIELVNQRTLGAVSSSTWMDKKTIVGETKVGFNYEFAELSLVRQPACDRCFIYAVEQLSKGKDLKVRETNIDIDNKIKEKEKMSSDIDESSEMEEETFEEPEEWEDKEDEALFAILELPDQLSLEQLQKGRKVRSYYYGYKYYPYYGYPYRYPYDYGYPYKYPQKSDQSDILFAVVELDNEEELDELRKIYKVKKYYKGKYGYPTPKKGEYGYGYPYGQKKGYGYPYKYPEKKSEDLAKEVEEFICPVDEKAFKSKEEFIKHWADEHQDQYGDYKHVAKKAKLVQEPQVKIFKSKKGRFIVAKATGKKFPPWKFIGNFATKKEADDFIAKLMEDELAEKPIKCPVDGEEFKTHDEFLKHWADKHSEKYGTYGKYAEKKVAKKYYPYYGKYKRAKYPVPKEKEEKSKEVEALSEIKEETPASAPIPTPEVKAEPAPAPIVEAPKTEVPVVEPPKVEEKPVVEEKKEPQVVIIRVETPAPIPVVAPAAVPTPVPAIEPKVEEKVMTPEEIYTELKKIGSAELLVRLYTRKEA